jgi:rfaE bifunctional protein kinase chain/domain
MRMTTEQILAAFPNVSALVVGDICLDRWSTYDAAVSGPSRETGIPRIGAVRTETTPGAGGAVANNLAALGAGRVAVLGIIGEDGFGWDLCRALERRGISFELCLRSPALQTFTYTKLINAETGIEDLPRYDCINTVPLDPDLEGRYVDRIRKAVPLFDVVLISDQAETSQGGVVTPAVRNALAGLARQFPDKVFFADSRERIELFESVVLKANRDEAEGGCRRLLGRIDYPEMLRRAHSKLLIITRGGEGTLVVEESGETAVETAPVANPVDICGAGDSFSAAAALALYVSRAPVDAARLGNLAALVTIMKRGTGTASPSEILAGAGASV